MASSLELTGSQRGAHSRSESHPPFSSEAQVGHHHHGTIPSRDTSDGPPNANRDVRPDSPKRTLTRISSIPNLKSRLTSSLNPNNTTSTTSTSTDQPPLDDRRSPSPIFRPSHVGRPDLKKSLDKPLPQTPLASTYSTFPVFGRHEPDRRQPVEDSNPPPAESNMDTHSSSMNNSSMSNSPSSAVEGQTHDSLDQQYSQDMNASTGSLTSSLQQEANGDNGDDLTPGSTDTASVAASATPSPSIDHGGIRAAGAAVATVAQGSSAHLSGLMCNVHRTTGREPPPLVGATTTILGDKLYVFGGRVLARNRPTPLTSDLYELDLISRHWTKLVTGGDGPPPRYFHSMCALGDTKMVCYGGMSPAPNTGQTADSAEDQQQQTEVFVMSDIYIYDVVSRKWTYVPAQDAPQGRYAHCACILPSAASFSSSRAPPLAALHHNPSSSKPNEGRIGVNMDGTGGAEMIVVGGQDSANHYIEQISVFNLRSLKWTSTQPLGKSCGAYRSVAAALPPSVSAKMGKRRSNGGHRDDGGGGAVGQQESRETGSSMLIYSNYNFLDVKLELQIRSPDGTLAEQPMTGTFSPPGLRFPNGGMIDTHFVVSGTYLTSSKQEYALWALDLRTLVWSRIDAGGSVFSQGSWNRGVLWNRRNTFVILGNRKRSLVDDYNHRRINFSNVCMVELEAFGFYDNPRKTSPLSGFISASSPYSDAALSLARKAGYTAGGRLHSRASEELGDKALAMRELADMDILCIGGERIPVNSRMVCRRWGPYFVQLLREGTATHDGSDAVTPRSGLLNNNNNNNNNNNPRMSALTITSSSKDATQLPPPSSGTTTTTTTGALSASSGVGSGPTTNATAGGMSGIGVGGAYLGCSDGPGQGDGLSPAATNAAPTPRSLPPKARPRCLYLPHTYLTVQALLHFLYTSSLPPPTSPLCTPQILCSLLQISRPYRIDGLLEAVVERLHGLLDSRNAAAVFNATAMAAGGGRGIDGSLNPNFFVRTSDPVGSPTSVSDFSLSGTTANESSSSLSSVEPAAATSSGLGIKTSMPTRTDRPPSGEISASTTSLSGSEWSSDPGGSDGDNKNNNNNNNNNFIWTGELSSVIGLQKRGLRGLMEGRRIRERTGTSAGPGGTPFPTAQPAGSGGGGGQRVGLGIAGS